MRGAEKRVARESACGIERRASGRYVRAMARDVAVLEALLRTYRPRIAVDGVDVIAERDVPAVAVRIDEQLEQVAVAESVVRTINFYRVGGRVDAAHPGVAALIAEVEAWAQQAAVGRDPETQRGEVTAAIRRIFEAHYGAAHGDAWIDVDTTDFMLDPAVFLETVADHFGIAMPPYGTNRDVIAFVLARISG